MSSTSDAVRSSKLLFIEDFDPLVEFTTQPATRTPETHIFSDVERLAEQSRMTQNDEIGDKAKEVSCVAAAISVEEEILH
jgi:hypothetical protein